MSAHSFSFYCSLAATGKLGVPALGSRGSWYDRLDTTWHAIGRGRYLGCGASECFFTVHEPVDARPADVIRGELAAASTLDVTTWYPLGPVVCVDDKRAA